MDHPFNNYFNVTFQDPNPNNNVKHKPKNTHEFKDNDINIKFKLPNIVNVRHNVFKIRPLNGGVWSRRQYWVRFIFGEINVINEASFASKQPPGRGGW